MQEPLRNVKGVFSTVAAVLIVSIAFTYWMGLVAVESVRRLAHQGDVISTLDRFLSTLKDAETGQRGYLLTGEAPYLGPYREALARFKTEIENLNEMAKSGDISAAGAAVIRDLASEMITEISETVQLRQEKGLDAALAVVRSGRGKALMDRIRSEVSSMEATERSELQAASSQMGRATAIRSATFASVGLLNLGFLLWAYRRINGERQLRECAALEIARQKEMLAVTLASIGDGVIVTDEKGCVTFLNPEAERLCGWKLGTAQGLSLSAIFPIVHEATRQPVENPVEKVLRLGRVVGLGNHTILIARDGRETPIDDSAAPIRDAQGHLFGVVLVFRDFSEHKQQERFDEALNAIGLIIHSSRQTDEVLRKGLAAAAEALCSESAAVSLRRNGGWEVSYVHGLNQKMIGARMDDNEERHALLAITTKQPVAIEDAYQDERVNREHMKKWGIRSVLAMPLLLKDQALGVMFFNHARTPVQFTPAHLDFASKLATSMSLALENSRLLDELHKEVKERKAAEEALRDAQKQLRQHAENLEQTVKLRTAKLQETVRDLEQFSYSLAHDLRAPLRSMCSFSTLLLEDCSDKLASESLDHLKRICSAAKRMDDLIRDVLAYSQVLRSDSTLQRVDLDRLTHEIVAEYPNLSPELAEVEFRAPLLPVKGSVALLTQCVSNLLGNGVKFVKPGVKPHLCVWTEPLGAKVRFCVQDNGIGIAPDQIERIWRIFERGHGAQEYPGTGIGLSIVKRAAEKLGGTVGVTSTLAQGSTFWLELEKA